MNKDEVLDMKAGKEVDMLVARKIMLDGYGKYFDSIHPKTAGSYKIKIPNYSTDVHFAQKVLDRIKEKYPLLMYGNNLWECRVFLPTGRVVSSGSARSFSLAACKAALLMKIEEDRHKSSESQKCRMRRNFNYSLMGDLNTAQRDKKWRESLIKSFYFFIAGVILLSAWNVFSAKEIKKSGIERDELRRDVEKVRIMEKVNWDGIEEVFRYRAIRLCFEELIGKYEGRFSLKEKENCILLIDLTDEMYGHRGLDASLIFAWLQKESAGNPIAVSWAGAKGLTQLMDFRADQILTELGYSGFDRKLVFNPEINLAGGIHHLWELMNYWSRKGIKSQSLSLFYAIHSYKWGSLNTLQLFNSEKREYRPAIEYVNWILNRREKWVKKMRNLIDDKLEIVKTKKAYIDAGLVNLFPLMWLGI